MTPPSAGQRPSLIRRLAQNRDVAACLLLLLAAFVFMGGLFLQGRVWLARDTLFDFLPWHLFIAHAIAGGQFPFWCPYLGAGTPLFGGLDGMLYPPNVIFSLLSPALAIKCWWLFHLWVAGVSLYLLVRQFSIGRIAALTAGLSFMFSALVMGQLEFMANLGAVVWCPLPLALVLYFVRRREESDPAPLLAVLWRQKHLIALLALVFALQATADFPEFLLYPLLGSVGALAFISWDRKRFSPALAGVAFLALGGLLALLLVLPEIVSSLEYLAYSERSGAFDPRFWMASITPAHLLTALFPFIGGRPGFPDTFWDGEMFEYWIGAFYMGVLPVFAAPFALLWFGRNRETGDRGWRLAARLGAVLIVVGLVLAAGENTPIYPWLYHHFPLLDRFRFASKFLILVALGLALVAASGLDALLGRPGDRRGGAIVRAEAAVLLALIAGVGLLAFRPEWLRHVFAMHGNIRNVRLVETIPSLVFDATACVAAAALLAVLLFFTRYRAVLRWFLPLFVFANLFLVTRRLHPSGPDTLVTQKPKMISGPLVPNDLFRFFTPKNAAKQYLYANEDTGLYEWGREAGMGAAWLPYGVNDAFQSGALKLESNVRLMQAFKDADESTATDRLADLLGIRWVINGPAWPEVLWAGASRELTVVERPTAKPRFWMASAWEDAASQDGAWRRMGTEDFSEDRPLVETVALLGGEPVDERHPAPPLLGAAGKVRVVQSDLNRISLKTESSDSNLLVISDTWYPGWRAEVDGREAPIFRVNYAFRGLFLPPGPHAVTLSYFPNHFLAGCGVSLLGALAIALCFLRKKPL